MKFLVFGALFLQVVFQVKSQEPGSCHGGLCLPSLGNLLIGRDNKLTASATDGIYGISNVITSSSNRGRYWKAPNGMTSVSIRLDLESFMYFDGIKMEFKDATDKPKAMIIEKSKDFGRSWKRLHYFADNCESSFPGIITGERKTYEDVVTPSCSQLDATSKKVEYKLIPANVAVDWARKFHFSQLTNLRINLTELRDSPTAAHKISQMNVVGTCLCYGHAVKCAIDAANAQKVNGQCECLHNTKGPNCELCQDLYNDKAWTPGYDSENFECQKCNCNNRATECMFSPHQYEATNGTSGGACLNCSNSIGKNCERCKTFFYLDKSDNSCKPCNCDPNGSYTRLCDATTGQCSCKSGLVGRTCGNAA